MEERVRENKKHSSKQAKEFFDFIEECNASDKKFSADPSYQKEKLKKGTRKEVINQIKKTKNGTDIINFFVFRTFFFYQDFGAVADALTEAYKTYEQLCKKRSPMITPYNFDTFAQLILNECRLKFEDLSHYKEMKLTIQKLNKYYALCRFYKNSLMLDPEISVDVRNYFISKDEQIKIIEDFKTAYDKIQKLKARLETLQEYLKNKFQTNIIPKAAFDQYDREISSAIKLMRQVLVAKDDNASGKEPSPAINNDKENDDDNLGLDDNNRDND